MEKLGDLTVYDRTSLTDEDEIISRIGGAEVVLTNKTPISRRVMDACPSMRFIAMLATGYNVVDIACAKEKASLSPTCRSTAPIPSASLPSPCCLKSAITSVIIMIR